MASIGTDAFYARAQNNISTYKAPTLMGEMNVG
jgi:hypothetical protein